jgi:excisionase family DNA binding protein
MAQQMMNQPGGILAPQATPPVVASPSPLNPPAPLTGTGLSSVPDLLSPAEAAKILGVSEADVVATLSDGSLKGKKIGSTWRIPRAAIDEFLKS